MSTPITGETVWPELQRTRRAIVVVDVVESVRLMQANEADVIDRWRRFVAEVRSEVLPKHGGRLVKSLGDGMLLEFEGVPSAVEAALAIQARVTPYNVERASDAHLHLRVGINQADVVVDELDIYGAGVNVAARLASLAGPGEIVVSAQVQDQICDGLHGDIEDLGPRYVKHLDEPLRAFRVTVVGDAARPLPAVTADLRPTLAVIPFLSEPSDLKADALGHAMADDIIAALSRHAGLRVLSRLSTGAFRNRHTELGQILRMLKASYVLSGRYYTNGDMVRLSVELCDSTSGEVLWAGRPSANVQQLFAGEDSLIPHVVSNVSQCVLAQELLRTRSLPMSSLQSYTLYLGATGLMNSLAVIDFDQAKLVLDHLAERHPRQGAPYAQLAKWHVLRLVQGWSADPAAEARLISQTAQRSIDLDPNQALALSALGLAKVNFDYDLQGAERCYLDALASDPQEPYAWAMLSGVQVYLDKCEEARRSAMRAVELSPLDPSMYLFKTYVALSELSCGQYDDAMDSAKAALRLNGQHLSAHRLLVMALSLAGRGAEARVAAARYCALDPDARVSYLERRYPGRDSSTAPRFAQALRAAGVPE